MPISVPNSLPSSSSSSSSSIYQTTESDSTGRNLEENSKRRSSCSSPYYRGLTDSSLYITRQRSGGGNGGGGGGVSPVRESSERSTTMASTSSSPVPREFTKKIQDWGSLCFKGKGEAKSKGSSSVKLGTSNSCSSSSTDSASLTFSIKDFENLGFDSKSSSLLGEEKSTGVKCTSSLVDANSSLSIDVKNSSSVVEANSSQSMDVKNSLLVGASSSSLLIDTKSSSSSAVATETVLIAERAVGRERKNGKRFVWSDKYRPKALKDFICNRDKAEHIQTLVEKRLCSHYIFEGPPGVGKRTMIWALLREAFGLDNSMTREECRTFELKGEAKPSIQVNVKLSSHHVEVNLSEVHGYEKHVIVELIKETQNKTMDKLGHCDHTKCHAIIIHQADKLSRDAQHYIRWLMERDKGCNKIFFCCTEFSRLEHIRSICSVIQLLPPSNKEIVEVLEFIALHEGIKLPHQLAERIADNSKQNLRQAIRSFEATWQLNYPFKDDQVIMTGWEDDVANIAKKIIQEQSPKQLYVVRGKLQNLLDHNVSPQFIFRSLVRELKKHLNEEFQSKIDSFYLEYKLNSGGIFDGEKSLVLLHSRYEESRGKSNNELRKNVQHFMMIEEFTAKFMSFYKSHVKKKTEGTTTGY